MKTIFSIILICLLGSALFSQEKLLPPITIPTNPTPFNSCCAVLDSVVITAAQMPTLNTNPVTIKVPPLGCAIRLVKPPVIKVKHPDGQPILFASGEQIRIEHAMSQYSGHYLSRFDDYYVHNASGLACGTFWESYEMLYNGQPIGTPTPSVTNGAIKVRSTVPLTPLSPNTTITIYVWYEEIKFL